MLRRYRYLVLLIMTILIITACSQEDKDEVQSLLSDKQSQTEEVAVNADEVDRQESTNSGVEVDNYQASDQANSSIQQSTHKPTSQQKIVYTKLNTWSDSKDYYEIAFSTPIDQTVETADLREHIEFSPPTTGRFEKVEDKVIRFYPVQRFKGDTDYKVMINQASLLAGEYAKVELSFYNSSPILRLGQVSLHPTTKNNEYYLEFIINYYRGRYPDEDNKKGMNIRLGSKRVGIEKISYNNSGEILLTTNTFTATENDKIIISPNTNVFNVNKRQLYYANSIKQMQMFILHQTNTVTDKDGNARIELSFSKNLDTDQALIGLISVHDQKEVPVTISKFMNKVIISGNFQLNKEYSVKIKSGIKATDNSVLKETKTEVIHTYNRNRTLEFADKGVFLSSLNNNSINIKVVNYAEFEYQLWAVQVENIAEMIHNINIYDFSNTNQSNYYRNDNLNWYGEQVKSGKIDTEVITDKDSFIKLDLGRVAKADPNMIYILNLSGNIKEDDTLNIKNSNGIRYYRYNNTVSKMLLFTDLAVTAKAFKEKVLINVVDVTDASPVRRADVELRSFNNTLLASGKTGRDGELTLDKLTKALDNEQFFIVAERKGALGFLSSNEMFLDNTKFKIERDYSQAEYKLELFLDRDLYRPGETVNLMVMVRDSNNELVDVDLPLSATVYDPKNAKISTEKITDLSEGFANYKLETSTSSNTGNWRIEVEYASQQKSVNFKLETFVPERINVTLKADKEEYEAQDSYFDLTLSNSYLFGAPLVGANCRIDIDFNHNYNFAKDKFSEYSFVDELASYDYSIFKQTQELKSDEEGLVNSSFQLLTPEESIHPYFLAISAKVTEEGGRPIERNLVLPASPYQKYIGLGNNRYIKAQAGEFKVPVVVVDASGEKLQTGTKVEYVVYGKQGSWWWDYNYSYQASYKKSESTTIISQGIATIGQDKYIAFTPNTSDFHLFIVEAKIVGQADYEINHKYFNSYWGDNSEIAEDSSLELKIDKDEYAIGETVKVSIPTSKGSKLFLTIIKQNEIIKQEVIDIKANGDYIYEFQANASMTPNLYLDVRVVQGQKAQENDLPLRLYGIIPIKVIDKNTRLEIKLDIPERINSNSKLTGKIDVGVKKKTQYIVSIVDQGLVNRTDYTMPNPWNLFYRNEGYFAQDYDNFSFFVNAQNQEIFRTIMIGGGLMFTEATMAMDSDRVGSARKEMNRLQETGVQRFKPVSYFLGILETDSQGKAEFNVDIEDYFGALKVTVIAVNELAFGRAVDYTIVKDDIIAMPTLPRVLTPNDEIEIPISVVIDPLISSDVEIELATNDLVEITSQAKQIIPQGKNSALLIFSAKVKENIGKAEFYLKITSKEFVSQKEIEVGVRLPSAYQSDSKILSITGDELNIAIPELGYGDSSQSYLSFTQGFEFDADKHLQESIRYPYGGAVMKTANTFVQLLLSDFIKDVNLSNQLDANVNSYFQEIVNYNMQGLWEWSGYWDYAENRKILNAYALHTSIIAKEKGYNIQEFVYGEMLDFLKKPSQNSSNIEFEDAYQLYVLALAGQANIASLNYYNEQETIYVNSSAKTMLEMAYRESGFDINDITKDLKAKVVIQVTDNPHNYLAPNEEVAQALELYYNSIYNNNDQAQKAINRATALALAKKMQESSYWNHYEKGWNLFALAGYVSTLPKDYQNYTSAEFEVSLADKNEKIKVDASYVLDLTNYKNQSINIKALSSNAKDVTVTMNNIYVPKLEDTKSTSNNIDLFVLYTDLNGNEIDVSSLEQGEGFIAEIKTIPRFDNMEFATTYILPSGWEFSTSNVEIDKYNRYNRNNKPTYVDTRDDRVIIYGKGNNNQPTSYKCQINTITKGKFMLPASTSEDIYQMENQAVIKGRVVEVK